MEWGDTENRFYIRIWETKKDGHGVLELMSKEAFFDDAQECFREVYTIKRDLKKEGWVEKPLGTTQGSFIVNEGIDGKISKTIGKA